MSVKVPVQTAANCCSYVAAAAPLVDPGPNGVDSKSRQAIGSVSDIRKAVLKTDNLLPRRLYHVVCRE